MGFILLYFIWKHFADLAKEYITGKPWVYGLLGCVIYYVGQLAFGFTYGIFVAMGIFDADFNETLINLAAIPFGILFCYLLRLFLMYKWRNSKLSETEELLDV